MTGERRRREKGIMVRKREAPPPPGRRRAGGGGGGSHVARCFDGATLWTASRSNGRGPNPNLLHVFMVPLWLQSGTPRIIGTSGLIAPEFLQRRVVA
eukprot:8162408-Pyramimonas_sp.AAC.1